MCRNNVLICGLIVASLCSSANALADADDGGGWILSWLDLEITIEPDEKLLLVDGVATFRLELETSYGPDITLNSRAATMEFLEVAAADSEAKIVRRIPGKNARVAKVRREALFSQGDEIEVEFSYTNSGRQGNQFTVGEDVALASWVEAWYPAPIQWDLSVGHSQRGSAPGTSKFNLPQGWRSLSNGIRIEQTAWDGLVTETWEVDFPVARSFAAGPYNVAKHTVGDRDVEVYRLSDDAQGAAAQARGLALALQAIESRLGEYPYPSCHLAEVPGRFTWGASSEQGFVMAMSDFFRWGENLPLFAHEACHGWWGNLVNSQGAGHKMCSEALAQYGAVIAIEALEGPEALAEFLKFSRLGFIEQQCARGYFSILRAGSDIPLAQMQSEPSSHNIADSKGNWVYHMLRHRVGDELFFATLRKLIDEFRGERMSLADIRQAYVDASPPEARVERFFEDWLDRGGAPVVDVTWSDSGGELEREVKFTLTQNGAPYHLPLDLEIHTSTGKLRHHVDFDENRTTVSILLSGELQKVVLDPDTRLLIWRPEYGPQPTSAASPQLEHTSAGAVR